MSLANEADPFIGRFMSNEDIFKKIFRMSEEDIEKTKKQIAKEKKSQEEPTSLTLQGIDMQQQQVDQQGQQMQDRQAPPVKPAEKKSEEPKKEPKEKAPDEKKPTNEELDIFSNLKNILEEIDNEHKGN
jgi:hypothetical protein